MPQPPAPGTGRERLCTWGLTCHLFGDECWFQRASSSELCFDSGIIIHVGRPRETAVRAHSAACKLTVPFHCRTASRATHPALFSIWLCQFTTSFQIYFRKSMALGGR